MSRFSITSSGTYKATAMDMARSDARMIIALGPADFGGIERVRARLSALAAAGPAARLGLRVTPSSRHWAFRPDLVCDDVAAVDPIERADVPDHLAALAATASTNVPLRARLAGEYLLLDLSHGFSDAILPIELYVFLADAAVEPRLPGWAGTRTVRSPLPRALAGWMVHNPRHVLDIAHAKFRSVAFPSRPTTAARRPAAAADATTGAVRAGAPAWVRSPAVAVGTSQAGAPSALRAWRDRHRPGLTVTSLLCAAVAGAVRSQGVGVANSATFLFDCRRYLRTREVVLGNFAVGIDFAGIDPTSPEDLDRVLTHAVDTGRPLAAGALSALRSTRRSTASPTRAETVMPAEAPPAELIFSDIGRVPAAQNISWTDEPSRSASYSLSEPADPKSIVITSMQIRDTFYVSASFHDNIFDANAVATALETAMSDPIATLSARARSRQEMSR